MQFKSTPLTWAITEIKSPEDLLPPGAEPGTVPTDLEQATGLERLEILGKMQGIDIFDMRPLPSDRVGGFVQADSDTLVLWNPDPHGDRLMARNAGTFKDPIVVKSAGDELQCGCTGCPADSHGVRWVVVCLNICLSVWNPRKVPPSKLQLSDPSSLSSASLATTSIKVS